MTNEEINVKLPTLELGCEGGTVATLQLILQGHTNPRLLANGYFGPETKLEVQEFQRKMGLDDDGVVGVATWRKLLGLL